MGRKAHGKDLEFGRRGREKAAPTGLAPTSMERLKLIGARWWGKKQPPKKKNPRALGLKRSRHGV